MTSFDAYFFELIVSKLTVKVFFFLRRDQIVALS